jgi:hypothetical protein
LPTGYQVPSYSANDDGALAHGRLANFYQFTANHSFGHNYRFVGVTGGYYDHVTAQYKTAAGVVSTKALTFIDNCCRDLATDLDWYMTLRSGAAWATAQTNAQNLSLTINGQALTGWFVPNDLELLSIRNRNNPNAAYNYAPFSLGNTNVWTSCGYGSGTANKMSLSLGTGIASSAPYDNVYQQLVCRYHES